MINSPDKNQFHVKRGNPELPGVHQIENGYHFTVLVEGEKEASLILYRKGSTEVLCEIPLPIEERVGSLSSVSVEGLRPWEFEYNFRIGGAIVSDPYARALTGGTEFGINEKPDDIHRMRGQLCEMRSKTNRDSLYIPYEDMILYKLHVRGFSKHRLSKVKAKGTFTGLVEKIPYLQGLGITSVELMPAYDFEEYPTCTNEGGKGAFGRPHSNLNYWGYSKGFYFAPKGSFCSTEKPTAEFELVVEALHAAGIECLMEFYFPAETSPVFILEVLRFWKRWYGVDGFHLVGDSIPVQMIVRDPMFHDTKLLYLGFDVSQIYGRKVPAKRLLAEYNLGFLETMRKFLKGDEDQVTAVTWNLRRNFKTHGVMNYMTCQDGFTLADLVSYDYRHNEENKEENRDGSAYNYSWNCGAEGVTRKLSVLDLRLRQMKNAMLFMLLSQGTPMIYAGDELGNSQKGNNNAYCQDNIIGWVDWSKSRRSDEMQAFVKDAIAFRKAHRILHVDHEVQDTDYRAIGIPEISYHSNRAWVPNMEACSRQLGVLYCGAYVNNADENADSYLYIAYNMHWEVQEFALPKLPVSMKWSLAVDSGAKNETGVYDGGQEVAMEQGKKFKVPPRTIMVLIGR